MEQDFKYYILKNPVDNKSLQASELPVVIKISKALFGMDINLNDKNEAEGPFVSKFELRRQSTIFSSIRLQKHKDRVLKNKHIKEIKDYVLTTKGNSYEKTFVGALHHTIVGKITRKKVSGVHFYNPDSIKVLKVIQTNDLGVYSAVIEKLHPNTKQWIIKEEITNFFPDNWTINQLFHECASAYSIKKNESGNVYLSETPSGIKIKFIINEDGKIITFYPII
ncbi:EndoU domain-containing protein [Polaribacter uvawellassae]|uniref:EndoU domain-containing protein n=1 Tax=Polaribacter uvawellassae TaxID=3133495 RepID=UPI00321BF5CC